MRLSPMLRKIAKSSILTLTMISSILTLTIVGMPFAQGAHADGPTNATGSSLLTCHSEPVVLQGHHLDGSIDPTSVLHVTLTTCEGGLPSTQTSGSLHTLSRLRLARSSMRPADYLGNQAPLGPGGNGCGYGVQGDAEGTPNSGSAYAHYFYVNPSDGQTIDYASIGIAGGSPKWISALGAPSNISYTSVAVYYTQQNSPWLITRAYCGSLQL